MYYARLEELLAEYLDRLVAGDTLIKSYEATGQDTTEANKLYDKVLTEWKLLDYLYKQVSKSKDPNQFLLQLAITVGIIFPGSRK